MDIVSYTLSKKVAAAAVSGVADMNVEGTTLYIVTNDGKTLEMVFPTPKDGKDGVDGVSVADIDINENHELIFVMSDGSQIESGKIEVIKGDKGDKGDPADSVADTTSGTNPTLENSTHAPFITFKGDGATEQQTYSGKNLLPNTTATRTSNGITFTVNDDKSVTANGTATDDAYLVLNTKFTIPAGTILSGCPSGGSETKYALQAWVSGSSRKADYGNGVSFTDDYATNEIYIVIRPGVTVSNLKFYPMIRLSTETDATYEPYVGGTASPNPSYPQEIHGVGESGVLEVKSTGKNIFGGLQFAQAIVDSGSTNVVLDTDAKTVTYGHNTTNKVCVLFDKFKENTRYTLILGVKDHVNAGTAMTSYNVNLRIQYTDGTIDYLILSKTATPYTAVITTAPNKSVKELRYYYGEQDITTLNYEQCGIFEGVITADEFEPYTETKANIPLSAPLYDGDYIRYNMDGTGELVRKMARVVYDGSERGWVINQTCFMTNYHTFVPLTAISSHFIGMKTVKAWTKLANGEFQNYDRAFGFKKTDLTTVEEWKAWLAENPITVIYELAEPTVTPLTAEQIAEFEKLQTFDVTTHVTCEAECEMDYFRNSVSGKAVASVIARANNAIIDVKDDIDVVDLKVTNTYNRTTVNNGILAGFDYETGEMMDVVEDGMSVNSALKSLEKAVINIANGVMQNKSEINQLKQ